MRVNNIVKQTEEAKDRFFDDISKIAEEVRQKVVIPLCWKRKLYFRSGNGTYYFYYVKTRKAYHDTPKDIKKAFEILDIDVDAYNSIGNFVNDYDETIKGE